jgi:hypothetical protein
MGVDAQAFVSAALRSLEDKPDSEYEQISWV